ncbi:MAG TPA: hypothetical protein VHG29_08400 [Novosphingobium sp.]|nr:hypothetical protein [Novosphingobium sp.]
MNDQATTEPGALTLPAFAPVPRAKDRHNGWKPEVQRAFIEALAETGSVRSACARVSRADHGAYLLRRHPEAQEFRRAWDVALDIGMRRIEDVAMDRALHGVETPVYSYGKIVGTRTVYNDRLLMFMLRNRAPDRFTGGQAKGLNAVDAMQLKRIEAKLRAQWEAEREAESARDGAEIVEEIDRQLARMHEVRIEAMSPRTRRLHEALEASQRLDRLHRSRRDVLSLPPTSGARLWDGTESHGPRNTLGSDYLNDVLGPPGTQEAAQQHHYAKLVQRGVLEGEGEGEEDT